MASIHFDCFIDPKAAALTPARFEQLSALLIRDALVQDATVTHTSDAGTDAATRQQLIEVLREQAGDKDEPVAAEQTYEMHRFTVKVEGARSLNQVAMLYSRLLAPAAALPVDTVAYPWTMQITD